MLRNSKKFPVASLTGTVWNALLLITTAEARSHRGSSKSRLLHFLLKDSVQVPEPRSQVRFPGKEAETPRLWSRLTGTGLGSSCGGEGSRTGSVEGEQDPGAVPMGSPSNPAGSQELPWPFRGQVAGFCSSMVTRANSAFISNPFSEGSLLGLVGVAVQEPHPQASPRVWSPLSRLPSAPCKPHLSGV